MSEELDSQDADADIVRSGPQPVAEADEGLPVVARMVVEIRSDGSRTVARGGVEDLLNDEQVTVEARADSPLELSRALAKMLLSAPFAASSAILRGGGRSQEERDAIDAAPEPGGRRGLRKRVRSLRRELGARLEREVQARLLADDDEA